MHLRPRFGGGGEGGGQKSGGLADDGQSRTCLLAKSQRRRQRTNGRAEMGKTEAADETKLRSILWERLREAESPCWF